MKIRMNLGLFIVLLFSFCSRNVSQKNELVISYYAPVISDAGAVSLKIRLSNEASNNWEKVYAYSIGNDTVYYDKLRWGKPDLTIDDRGRIISSIPLNEKFYLVKDMFTSLNTNINETGLSLLVGANSQNIKWINRKFNDSLISYSLNGKIVDNINLVNDTNYIYQKAKLNTEVLDSILLSKSKLNFDS